MILSEDGHEMIMASCCPNSPNGPLFWVKLCPLTSNLSSCGMTVTGACATCPGFPQPYAPSCSLSIRYDNWNRLYIHHCNAAPGTPPTIAVGPPIEIWPPNHEMRTFTLADFVTSAVDACENAIDVNARGTITSITSNESVSDDFAITGSSFEVRADRDGFGNGRVYEIHFSVPDASGTSASGVALVRVPHDRK